MRRRLDRGSVTSTPSTSSWSPRISAQLPTPVSGAFRSCATVPAKAWSSRRCVRSRVTSCTTSTASGPPSASGRSRGTAPIERISCSPVSGSMRSRSSEVTTSPRRAREEGSSPAARTEPSGRKKPSSSPSPSRPGRRRLPASRSATGLRISRLPEASTTATPSVITSITASSRSARELARASDSHDAREQGRTLGHAQGDAQHQHRDHQHVDLHDDGAGREVLDAAERSAARLGAQHRDGGEGHRVEPAHGGREPVADPGRGDDQPEGDRRLAVGTEEQEGRGQRQDGGRPPARAASGVAAPRSVGPPTRCVREPAAARSAWPAPTPPRRRCCRCCGPARQPSCPRTGRPRRRRRRAARTARWRALPRGTRPRACRGRACRRRGAAACPRRRPTRRASWRTGR